MAARPSSFLSLEPHLTLIMGPMMSGKTTYMLQRLYMYQLCGLRVTYFNHISDTRGSGFSSHNPYLTEDNLPTNLGCYKTDRLTPVELKIIDEYDVIGIDEGQFYPDLLEFARDVVQRHKKILLISGLNGDSNRKKFGQMIDLIPEADDVVFLHPFCKLCAPKTIRDASFSKCIVPKVDQVLAGGAESYIPVCRRCYEKT